MFESARELYLDEKVLGTKIARDEHFLRLLQLLAIMVCGISAFFTRKSQGTLW